MIKSRSISKNGGEKESTGADGREYSRGQFDDPSGDLGARHPFILARRKSPFWLRTITEQLLSTNLFIATRESIGRHATRTPLVFNVSRLKRFDRISPNLAKILHVQKNTRDESIWIPHTRARAERALDLRWTWYYTTSNNSSRYRLMLCSTVIENDNASSQQRRFFFFFFFFF